MRCGVWGKEPFDLRLTILRMIRCLPWILGITLVGTLLFGGGYILKNMVFTGEKQYSAKATFLVDYVDENWAQNLKYVNEYSWNIWMESDVFLDFVEGHLSAENLQQLSGAEAFGKEVPGMLSATVPSDLRVVQIAVTGTDPRMAEVLLEAVKAAMTEDFPAVMQDVAAIAVTDTDGAMEVAGDVRPFRAVLLAAVLSLFFAVVWFLVRELTKEQIWLPTTLSSVYGLREAGIFGTQACEASLEYFLQGKKRVAVIPDVDGDDSWHNGVPVRSGTETILLPNPMNSPEVAENLRSADGVLLIVHAGCDAKKLGMLLEFLAGQDIEVGCALLWGADYRMVLTYYGML